MDGAGDHEWKPHAPYFAMPRVQVVAAAAGEVVAGDAGGGERVCDGERRPGQG
jgi:hypothetical protein